MKQLDSIPIDSIKNENCRLTESNLRNPISLFVRFPFPNTLNRKVPDNSYDEHIERHHRLAEKLRPIRGNRTERTLA